MVALPSRSACAHIDFERPSHRGGPDAQLPRRPREDGQPDSCEAEPVASNGARVRLTDACKSSEPGCRSRKPARLALQVDANTDGRGNACQALRSPFAKPGAGAAVVGQVERKPGAALSLAMPIRAPPRASAAAPKPSAVSVLGPAPYAPDQALEALRAGRTVREVDVALSVLMSRRQARLLINRARAALLSGGPDAQEDGTNK